jgi:hypothetical protein
MIINAYLIGQRIRKLCYSLNFCSGQGRRWVKSPLRGKKSVGTTLFPFISRIQALVFQFGLILGLRG